MRTEAEVIRIISIYEICINRMADLSSGVFADYARKWNRTWDQFGRSTLLYKLNEYFYVFNSVKQNYNNEWIVSYKRGNDEVTFPLSFVFLEYDELDEVLEKHIHAIFVESQAEAKKMVNRQAEVEKQNEIDQLKKLLQKHPEVKNQL